jgi:hypothetical protein
MGPVLFLLMQGSDIGQSVPPFQIQAKKPI